MTSENDIEHYCSLCGAFLHKGHFSSGTKRIFYCKQCQIKYQTRNRDIDEFYYCNLCGKPLSDLRYACHEQCWQEFCRITRAARTERRSEQTRKFNLLRAQLGVVNLTSLLKNSST